MLSFYHSMNWVKKSQKINKMKRVVYLGYYFRQLDKKKFSTFFNYVVKTTNYKRIALFLDIVISSLKYNISILDFFYFRFYEKNNEEREKWAGTGYMYEYQLKMNPKSSRSRLENKIQFLRSYKKYIYREIADLETLKNDPNQVSALLNSSTGKIVLKLSTGQVGAEVKVYETKNFTPESLIKLMEEQNFDLAEEYIIQHPALNSLSPSGVNTVRIFTQLDEDNGVILLGARLRISINSPVDNLGAGNIATPIDIKTGIVSGNGVYSDITKTDESVHPVTGIEIKGFQVPFWKETLTMIELAAKAYLDNRTIGWDIAITEYGPELIEGNHNWCKLLWQLPAKKGLKEEIAKFS